MQKLTFQAYLPSPLLFVIAMMPLNCADWNCNEGNIFTKSQKQNNHLLYIDDLEIFLKNEKELETLMQAIRIYCQDIGMGLA